MSFDPLRLRLEIAAEFRALSGEERLQRRLEEMIWRERRRRVERKKESNVETAKVIRILRSARRQAVIEREGRPPELEERFRSRLPPRCVGRGGKQGRATRSSIYIAPVGRPPELERRAQLISQAIRAQWVLRKSRNRRTK